MPSKKKIRRSTKKKLKQSAIEVRSGKRETRSYRSAALSVRKAADGSLQLLGTAIVFDSPSSDLGGFTEIVKYQSVQKSLQRNNDVFMLWQHDSSQPLARTKTGSLQLTLTSTGLDFVATLPQSPLGVNAYQAVADGTVDSVSFGFQVNPEDGDKWLTDAQGNVVRELWDIAVSEISPVTWAAYEAPHVDVRSAPDDIQKKLKQVDWAKRSDDDDSDSDEDDDDDDECNPDSPNFDPDAECEDRCDCDCDECMAGDCDECSDDACDDSSCLDADCPAQRVRAAHLSLLLRRMTS
jgi:HK97 family phage prohead protease